MSSLEQREGAVERYLATRPELVERLARMGLSKADIRTQVARRLGSAAASRPPARSVLESVGADAALELEVARPSPSGSVTSALESIVEEIGRPTLLIQNQDFALPPEEDIARVLSATRANIVPLLASVGRVEVDEGYGSYPVGTAWMVAPDLAITNRHVASRFADPGADGRGVLRRDFRGALVRVSVDFLEERGSAGQREAHVTEVVHLPPPNVGAPDIALLRLAADRGLPPPIPIRATALPLGSWIGVVGYPLRDVRIPEEGRAAEERYFQGVYGVKRLAPGRTAHDPIGGAPAWAQAHDATTLGGNSGSLVLDLGSGAAAGLHFSGFWKQANYFVSCTELAQTIASHGGRPTLVLSPAPRPDLGVGPPAVPVAEPVEEAPDDLSDRRGYEPDFILPGGPPPFRIPLPTVGPSAPGAVARLIDGGTVLAYRNFSVVMNEDRRLCYFSAVNIDGDRTFKIGGSRPGWRKDRRLDAALQVRDECYGSEQDGKFSRGHMTRREDPNWGESREEARVSNWDTFFVTNACPQFQPFNGGVWLGLEDYALENADQDDMRISVFTGPVFRSDDPVYVGVPVPVTFWKIIAFQHDQTRRLSATAYTMSQQDVLPTGAEFVFGQHRTSQTTIRHVESLTGLSFHHLRDHDPLEDGTESLALRPLRSVDDIVHAGGTPPPRSDGRLGARERA